MAAPSEEFAELVERARGNDERALAALIALYEREIQNVAQLLLGKTLRSILDPTDLVQSVHLRVIPGLRQGTLVVGSAEQLRAFATTVLRHSLIQHWRRYRCQVRHHQDLAAIQIPQTSADATAARELDPSRQVEYHDWLEHLLEQLKEEDRRLVQMRLQGYRTREISEVLGVRASVVRMRLSRLRRRLRLGDPGPAAN